jgi:D-alanyl-D-alanine dipeptidase
MRSLPSTPVPQRNRGIVIDLTVSLVPFQAIPSQNAALSTSSDEDIVEMGKLFDDLRTAGPTMFIRCSNDANTPSIGRLKS